MPKHNSKKRRFSIRIFVICCIVTFNSGFLRAYDDGSTLLPVQDIAVLHSRLDQHADIDFLFSFFETTRLFDTYFAQITNVSRKPDYILLFNGADQTDDWAVYDVKTKKRTDTILQEGVVATILIDDNPNEHYAMVLRTYPPFSSSYSLADKITSLFSANSNTTIYLSNEPIPNIPHYYIRAEYFRLTHNCTVEPEIIPLPGEEFSRDHIGFGLNVGLSLREKPQYIFYDNMAVSEQPTQNEVFSGAALAFNIFPGRDPQRHYTEMIWSSRFYKRFFSRLSLQSGLLFTRSRELFGHYIFGLGIRVFRRTDLVFGTMFTTQPKVAIVSEVSLEDRWRADQVFPSERITLPYIGVTINMLEF